MIKVCAVVGTDFFLFWAMNQNFTQIYGQTAIFDHFVRNRHFSSSPITDKPSIFIGVSVIGSDFAKCSAAQSLHLTLVTGKTVLFGICP